MTIQELSTKYATSPFKVDGYCVPSPHLGAYLHEWERVSRSYNNSKGDFIDVTIAQKDKFNWHYEQISLAELRALDGYIKNRISTGTNSFSVTSWTPDRGYVTKVCYLGAPIQMTPLGKLDETAGIGYLKFEYHWIQIKGYKSLTQG